MEQVITSLSRFRMFMKESSLNHHGVVLSYVVLSALCIVLYVSDLSKLSPYTDEWYSFDHSSSAKASVMDSFHPPLYYFSLWLWRAIAPLEEMAAIRAFSVIFLIATLMVWVKIWKSELNETRIVPILAFAICVVSPHVILYGRLGRHFTLTAFVVAVTMYCFMKLVRQPNGKVLAGVLLSHIAIALEDYWAFAVVVGTECAYVVLWKRSLLKTLGICVAVGFGSLLITKLAFQLEQAKVIAANGAGASWKSVALALGYPFWSLTVGENVSMMLLVLAGPALVAWLFVGIRLLGRRDTTPLPDLMRIGLLNLFVLLLGCVMMVMVGGEDLQYLKLQTPKLLFPFAPMFYMLPAYVMGALIKAPMRWVLATVVVLPMVVGTVNYHRGEGFLHPVYNMPWRESLQIISESASASDAVFTVDGAFSHPFIKSGVKATLDILGDDFSAVRERKYQKIWLVTRPIPHEKYQQYFANVEAAMNGSYHEVQSINLGEEGQDLIWLRDKLMGNGFKYRVTLKLYELSS